jgi:hypothetical protein
MKKVRKFAQGGKFDADTYERAKRFLGQSGEGGSTPALDEMIAKKQAEQAAAKKPPPQKTASARPSKPTSPKPTPLQQDIMNMNRQLDAARKQREAETLRFQNDTGMDYPAGLETQYMGTQDRPLRLAKGGKVSSASKRADGIAKKGKTRGKVC